MILLFRKGGAVMHVDFAHGHVTMVKIVRYGFSLVQKFGVRHRIRIVRKHFIMFAALGVFIACRILGAVVAITLRHILSHISLQVVA